jgi:hypothetical protein
MLRTSRGLPLRYQSTLIAGALFLSAGCNDSQTGTFNAAASEKAAAEKGLAPGIKSKPAAPRPLAKSKTGPVPRAPGGGAATPD